MSSPHKTNVKGIILRSLPYKERDAILSLACEERILSVFARGIFYQKSKNRRLSNPYTTVDLEVTENKDSYSLIRGIVLEYAFWIQEDLEATAVCMILSEIILPDTMTPTIYSSFQNTLNAFKNSREEGIKWACLCFYQVLKAKGIAPELGECISCGSRKKIRTLSMEEGGFLCENCLGNENPWSKKRLSFFHQLSRGHVDLDSDVNAFLQFEYLCAWYELYQDVSLRGFRFLKQVENLGSNDQDQDGNGKTGGNVT